MTASPPVMNKYQIMPPLTPEQFAELKEDIKLNGVKIPVEFDNDGNILDGHHRFQAFAELIEAGEDLEMFDKIVRTDLKTEEDKLAHVLALNLKRRHLTKEQRKEIVLRLRKPPFSYTLTRIASALKVSIGTVQNALEDASEEDKKEIAELVVQGANGVLYKAAHSPHNSRTFMTGATALREMQNNAIKATGVGRATAPTARAAQASAVADKIVTVRDGEVVPNSTQFTPAVTYTLPLPQEEYTPSLEATTDETGKLVAFPWYGGKASHLTWLLGLLPHTEHFVDVFGGSCSVLLNKPQSDIETYNDIDKHVVNFFRVLRDDTENLVMAAHLTPYSREERRIAYKSRELPNLTDLERARRFFVLARQSRAGLAQSTARHLNSWRYTKTGILRGLPKSSNATWQAAIDDLAAIANRLRRVQLECYPFDRVIELYDGPTTLFYCDPPYLHESRQGDHDDVYAYEMTEEEHVSLAACLHKVQGRAAISGYPSELYNELYKDWYKIAIPVNAVAASMRESQRVEMVWTNYPAVEGQTK